MSYLIISFSHKNTDIQLREKLAFNSDEEKERFLRKIASDEITKEVVLLSTCNRVEIITRSINIKQSGKNIIEKLSSYAGVDFDMLYDRADIYDNDGAVHHLFTVASALDSLVIGETQIVGQLKDAYRFSSDRGLCDVKMNRIMHYAFKCAANVRTATSLGTGSVSVASTAVAKAKEIVVDATNVDALVIGAGEMSELTIKHLLSSGFRVTVTSRNMKKAQDLAESFEEHIYVEPYDKLTSLLDTSTVMITATSAPYPIITIENTNEVSKYRYWFDIAVPRDIDENIDYSNLEIYSVDDLQDIVNQNMSLRASQAKQAYSIVSKMSIEFFSWLKTLEVEPLVKQLHLNAQEVIEKKVSNAIKKGFIKGEDKENIEKLCQTVISEYLHTPSVQIKSISKNMECDVVIGAIQRVFGINSDANIDMTCEHLSKKLK